VWSACSRHEGGRAETIDTVSGSARTLVKSAAEVGGDIGTVARNAVEGAIFGAKQVGLNVEERLGGRHRAIKGRRRSASSRPAVRNAVTGVIAGVKVVLKEPSSSVHMAPGARAERQFLQGAEGRGTTRGPRVLF